MSLTVRIYPSRIILIIKESISLEKTTHNLCFFFHFLLGHMINLVFFSCLLYFLAIKKTAMLLSIYTSFSLLIMAINSILWKKKKRRSCFLGSFGFFLIFFFNFCPLNFSRCYGLIDWFIYFNSTYIGYRIGNLPQVKNRFFINEKLKKKKEKKMKKKMIRQRQ